MEQIYRVLKSIERKGMARRSDFHGYWEYVLDLCETQGLIEKTRPDYISVILTERGYRYMRIFEEFMGYFNNDSFFKTFEESL